MSIHNQSYFSKMMESLSQSNWGYSVKEKFKQFFNHGYDFISFKNSIKTNYSILMQSSEHQIIKLVYSPHDFEIGYSNLKKYQPKGTFSSDIVYKSFEILMHDKKIVDRNPLKQSIVLLKDISPEDMPQAFEMVIKAQYKPLLNIIINSDIFKNKLNLSEHGTRYIEKCIAYKNENLMELLFEEISCYELLHQIKPATSFLKDCVIKEFHSGTKKLLECGVTIQGIVKDDNNFPDSILIDNSRPPIKSGNPSYDAIHSFFMSNRLQKELIHKVSHQSIKKKI